MISERKRLHSCALLLQKFTTLKPTRRNQLSLASLLRVIQPDNIQKADFLTRERLVIRGGILCHGMPRSVYEGM